MNNKMLAAPLSNLSQNSGEFSSRNQEVSEVKGTQTSIRINPDFKALIPPLSLKERNQLESNLLSGGCREDAIAFKTVEIEIEERENAIAFKTVEIEIEERENEIAGCLSSLRSHRAVDALVSFFILCIFYQGKTSKFSKILSRQLGTLQF